MHAAEAQLKVAQERAALYRSGSRPEEITAAENQLGEAEADLLRLKNGTRPEEIAAGRAAVVAAEANVKRLQTQLDEMRILAPVAATVETMELEPGDLIAAGQPVAVLNMKTSPWVRCYVPENRLGNVQAGEEVGVTVDALPGQTLKGRVRRVATDTEFTPRNVQTTEKRSELVFETKVDILEGGEKLRPGMYADVHISARAPRP